MMTIGVLLASVLAGGIAAISGFGIGSLLTPILAVHYGTKLAVAIVSVPHLVGTAARFIGLRKHIDKKVFLNFGILSAAGGLAVRCSTRMRIVPHWQLCLAVCSSLRACPA